jgi:RND family efflux transporter MFP subunit
MNNRTNRLLRGGFALLLGVVLAPAPAAWGQAQQSVISGVTKPYAHAKPGVNQFGTVLELPVKEGQVVHKGDVLLRQDDRQELAELKALELEASSTVRVDAAQADLKIKQVQLKRLQDLAKNGNANPTEVEEAQSKVIYGEAQVKIAQLELAKARAAAEKQRIKVEQMTVRSGFDGQIEQIDVVRGDVTDPQKPVMTLAQNDPLKVEFYLPIAQAKRLKMGQQVEVRYPDEEKWIAAKVTYMAPIADAASDTQKVGLEMKNVDGRASGMPVVVKLPPDVAGVAQLGAAADGALPAAAAAAAASPTGAAADAAPQRP